VPLPLPLLNAERSAEGVCALPVPPPLFTVPGPCAVGG